MGQVYFSSEARRLRIRNMVTGEYLQQVHGGYSDAELPRVMVKFTEMMNREHVAGSEHVMEEHGGQEQRYELVLLPEEGRG